MKIVSNFQGDAEWGVVPYMHKSLLPFNDEDSDEVLMNGVEWIYNDEIKKPYKDYKRKALLALWSPCEFTARTGYYHFDHYDFFNDVYCVCPFTCRFMNKHFGYEKFHYTPYPFTNYSVKEFYNYDSDCSWVGSVHGDDHIQGLEVLFNFNYKFITTLKNTWMQHPYEFQRHTHLGLSPDDKLVEMSKCRSSLSFNMIYMSPASQSNDFDAFKHFDKGIMPQFKVRTHEITSSKSVMLVKKDPWNLVEDFYEPEKEFVYFETFPELHERIEDIKNNFSNYENVIEKAYERSYDYTVEKIYPYIKTNNKNLITWNNNYV
jgi:hypothetical protein